MLEKFNLDNARPIGRRAYCRPCERVTNNAKNPRNNAISKIAYSLAPTGTPFYELPKAKRLELRELATRLYEAGKTAGSAETTKIEEGFVYIITNPAFPGYLKVGCALSPDSRVEGFNTGDPHRAYRVEYKVFSSHRERAEAHCHDLLAAYRGHGEWFKCSVGFARRALQSVAEAPV